jgi:hypothetical protein
MLYTHTNYGLHVHMYIYIEKIIGPKREVPGERKKLHAEELRDLYVSSNIIMWLNKELLCSSGHWKSEKSCLLQMCHLTRLVLIAFVFTLWDCSELQNIYLPSL